MVSKDSAVYRGIKTFLQVTAALLVFAVANSSVQNLLLTHPGAAALLAVVAGAVSVVQNVLDSGVPNI